MRHTLFALAAILAIASCSPQTFNLNVDVRQPSRSGLDLSSKTFAVVYLEEGTEADSTFTRPMAEGFTASLEEDYFGGEEVVGVYSIPMREGDYSSKDTLVRLVLDTGKDVVFLFDKVERGESELTVRLYVYDSMNKSDNVLSMSGNTHLHLQPGAVGAQAANKFLSQWATMSVPVVYYNSASWEKAAYYAVDFDWRSAVKEWIRLATEAKDLRKRACACYNVALGCFMLGDSGLALKWLDMADNAEKLDLSHSLREFIEQKNNK